ncbi:type VI secretion protein IcmF/TssM N-terminal domain-containing protein, partial [Escherichia coli]
TGAAPRSAVFSFSRQMQGTGEIVTALLAALLDGENMDVMLRGVWLTSSHRRLREHWLGWLMQTRARQPLNGLILTLDLPDLLTADKSRRETLVQNLRQQLQEIRQSLHCRLPVYVVLTRLDLLTGFAALFHSLDKKDRDAILGVTFTRRAHESDDWRSELGAFWQTWVQQVNLALSDLMLAQ